MRRIHYADVSSAARVLMPLSSSEQKPVCLEMIHRAQIADAHRLFTGRAHPKWGTGSLMEVARLRQLAPEPGFEDNDYVAALRVVLDCLHQTVVTRTHS